MTHSWLLRALVACVAALLAGCVGDDGELDEGGVHDWGACSLESAGHPTAQIVDFRVLWAFTADYGLDAELTELDCSSSSSLVRTPDELASLVVPDPIVPEGGLPTADEVDWATESVLYAIQDGPARAALEGDVLLLGYEWVCSGMPAPCSWALYAVPKAAELARVGCPGGHPDQCLAP